MMFDLSFYKNKRVLVTGHTGFKGTWLCETLVKAGAQVTGYALNPPTTPSLFEMCGLSKRMDSDRRYSGFSSFTGCIYKSTA